MKRLKLFFKPKYPVYVHYTIIVNVTMCLSFCVLLMLHNYILYYHVLLWNYLHIIIDKSPAAQTLVTLNYTGR